MSAPHTWEAGQQAIVCQSAYGSAGDHRWVGEVVKVTSTQLIVQVEKSQYRFAKATGREIGGDRWRPRWVEAPTGDAIAAIRAEEARARMLRIIRHTVWHEQSDEVIRAVYTALHTDLASPARSPRLTREET